MTDFSKETSSNKETSSKPITTHNSDSSLGKTVKGLGHEVKAFSKEAGHDLKDAAVHAKDQIVEQAKDSAETAKVKGNKVVKDVQTQLAGRVSSVASAFDRTREQFQDEDMAQVGQYAGQVGSKIQEVAHYIENKDITEMGHDLANFGRRQPVLFLAGAFALGIAASRFLSSSSPKA
ncbi:MAG: hypothetical protein KC422_17640 [Trueperaceae bacterium]|nr:hypothetical protein [Trueperaceae bacterium]